MDTFNYSLLLEDGETIKKLHPSTISDFLDYINKTRLVGNHKLFFYTLMDTIVTTKNTSLYTLLVRKFDITNDITDLSTMTYPNSMLRWIIKKQKKFV